MAAAGGVRRQWTILGGRLEGYLRKPRSADVPSRAAPEVGRCQTQRRSCPVPQPGCHAAGDGRAAPSPRRPAWLLVVGVDLGEDPVERGALFGEQRFAIEACQRQRHPPSNPVTPGVVQSFGFLVAGMAQEAGGAGSFAHMIHDEGPGTNCHGFASGGGEE